MRQDSALDTLAAARQAIAAAHPAVEPARSTPLSPQAPADPLVQARLLVRALLSVVMPWLPWLHPLPQISLLVHGVGAAVQQRRAACEHAWW